MQKIDKQWFEFNIPNISTLLDFGNKATRPNIHIRNSENRRKKNGNPAPKPTHQGREYPHKKLRITEQKENKKKKEEPSTQTDRSRKLGCGTTLCRPPFVLDPYFCLTTIQLAHRPMKEIDSDEEATLECLGCGSTSYPFFLEPLEC